VSLSEITLRRSAEALCLTINLIKAVTEGREFVIFEQLSQADVTRVTLLHLIADQSRSRGPTEA
jgi:hypothetical protein